VKKGDSEIDQIYRIFRVLGTPNEQIWPGFTQLPSYNPQFPRYTAQRLADVVTQLDADGLDLLQQMLTYDPARRISAVRALQHPYFRVCGANINLLSLMNGNLFQDYQQQQQQQQQQL